MASDAEVARNAAVRDAIAALTAPGQPYEMRTETIAGRSQRVWVHSPRDLRAVLEVERRMMDLGQHRKAAGRQVQQAVQPLDHIQFP